MKMTNVLKEIHNKYKYFFYTNVEDWVFFNNLLTKIKIINFITINYRKI